MQAAAVLTQFATRTLKRLRGRDVHRGDTVFSWFVASLTVGLAALLIGIFIVLVQGAWPALQKFGWGFLFSSQWDPVQEKFGALPVIFGTVLSSLLGIAIAGPISVGVALFLTELAPRRVAQVAGFLTEMLAAIPSVVYGLWGIFVLAPWLRTTVEPLLGSTLGFLPLFQGPPYGVGMLAAGFILAIMITPTITSICREVFNAVPQAQREAALGIGATRWEMMRLAVLAASRSGIFGACILGLGRALGETMAVTMLIGNRAEISASLFAPGQTMASVLANEYAEALGELHVSALMEVGLVLFAVTFLINAGARVLVFRKVRR